MRQLFKCYMAFTGNLYRILCLLICPAIIILVYGVIRWKIGENMAYGFSITCSFLLVEVIGNYLLSGGIASKQTEKLFYLKSSAKGEEILRNAMVADILRRFFYFVLELLLAVVISEILPENGRGSAFGKDGGISVFLGHLFAGYFYGTIGIMATRLFDSFRVAISVLGFLFFLASINCRFLYLNTPSYSIAVVYLLLSIVASICSIYIVTRRFLGVPR